MTGIIIQSRFSSSRLPGKILIKVEGKPILQHVVERCRQASGADIVVVATTLDAEDDVIVDFCSRFGAPYFRGDLNNVLDRFYKTAKNFKLSTIIRVNSDCPLADPEIIDWCIREFKKNKYDYISNVVPGGRTFPRGLDTEVFSFEALETAWHKAEEDFEKEHVTPYIWQNKNREFNIGPIIKATPELKRDYRICVDYPEDLIVIKSIYNNFYQRGDHLVNIKKVIDFLDENPDIVNINVDCEKKHDQHAPINVIQKNA